jgi:hypothetical protein
MVFVRCGLRGANESKENFAMTPFYDIQQNPMHNWQQMGQINPQFAQLYGASLGNPLGAYGQQHGQYGQYGAQPFGAFGHNAGWGMQPQWGAQPQSGQWGSQHRQLSPYDVNEVVRQLLPALPQIIAQAQQPFGYAAYGSAPRTLTPQDVNEVVRQLLPLLPQIVGALQQGQPPQQFAMHGGIGGAGGIGGGGFGQGYLGQNLSAQNPFAASFQQPFQQPWQLGQAGPYGQPQFQSAFGGPQQWGQGGPGQSGQGQGGPWQRQLSQQDVAEVTRQLAGLIPQVIGNLQSFNQQRMM